MLTLDWKRHRLDLKVPMSQRRKSDEEMPTVPTHLFPLNATQALCPRIKPAKAHIRQESGRRRESDNVQAPEGELHLGSCRTRWRFLRRASHLTPRVPLEISSEMYPFSEG